MNNGVLIVWGIVWFGIGFAIGDYNNIQTKYKMNLKCIQGELYEEIRPNIYAKSHLECFEQKTLVP